MFSSMFASLTAKIAGVALAAGVATTGALAASGALPGPAQAAASHVAASVGISLPDRDGHAGNENEEGMGVTPTVTATVTPTVSPTPEESDSPEATPGDEAAEQNHGSCVSFAAHAADVLGLHGAQHGAFVSMVAGDPSAVSARVTQGGLPDAACLSALAKAKAAVAGMTTTPTSTATDDVTAGGNEGKDEGHGKGDQDPAPAITPMSRLILPTGHGDQDHGGKDKPGDFSGLTTQTGSGS